MFITIGAINIQEPKVLPRRTHILATEIIKIAAGVLKGPNPSDLSINVTVISVRNLGDIAVNEVPDAVLQMIQDELFRDRVTKPFQTK